jgi:hypothetical protein
VVSDTSTDNTTILDGFTITGGNGNTPNSKGGGLDLAYSSAILSNLIVTGNSAMNGAGVYFSNGSPQLINSLITGNHAAANGGGLYLDNTGTLTFLVNITMTANSAAAGGGLYLTNKASAGLVNDLFWGDTAGDLTADQSGGATQPGTSYSLV